MEQAPLVDFTKLKKKRPAQQKNIINKFSETSELDDFVIKKTSKKENVNPNEEKGNEGSANNFDGFADYNYDFLLGRITNLIKKHNPKFTATERGPIKIPPPNIVKAGTTRSAWTNFTDICSVLGRPTDHLFTFILAELGTEGSLGGESQFILKGRYTNKHIESLLVKYTHDYVQCLNCKSTNTILKKDNSARLQMMACNECKAERTVVPIKAGVHKAKK